jgi:DNA polymerase-3 subunit gamma/tau
MTLYLKYRPQKISELDLESVRESLTKIVKSGDIPHAFLFSGPKGTGKTSAARIMAKVINCTKRGTKGARQKTFEPCNKCKQCVSITKGENLDVIELDAASHRGIDDVRTLRDAVKLAPALAKRKVYIIDEAHMLTTEASNALLKTLEEPPEHVMFILATTNPEKLIETIRSRTANIVFEKASREEIVRSLKKKIRGEKLKLPSGKAGEKVLELIAQAASSSFRDADKILEQLVAEKKTLNAKKVEEHLFQRGLFDGDDFIALLVERSATEALKMIEKAVSSGGSVKRMVEYIISRLRESLLSRMGLGGKRIEGFDREEEISLIRLLSQAMREIPSAFLEQIPLELLVIEWCEKGEESHGLKTKTESNLPDRKKGGLKGQRRKVVKQAVGNKKVNGGQIGENAKKLPEFSGGRISEEVWSKILTEIKPRNTSTEALLRASKPVDYDGSNLTLGVFYNFHKERLEEAPHRDIFEEVAKSVLGTPVKVICTLADPPQKKKVVKEKQATPALQGAALSKPDLILTEGRDEDIIKAAKEIFGS